METITTEENKITVITPVIDAKEFGIEETKALTISTAFAPKIAERDGYELVYKNILTKEVTEAVCLEARELRLKLVKTRTGIDAIHKAEKAFYLASGKYVDALKNKLTLPVEQMEEKLSEIEKFFENQEKERKEKIRIERFDSIKNLIEDANIYPLAEMTDASFEDLKNGLELAAIAKKEAAKKAEEEMIAKEKADAEERERLRIENERLQKEAEEKEDSLKVEREAAEKKLQEEKAKADAELAEANRLAKIESDRQADIIAKQKEESDRLAAELKAKADAEEAEKQKVIAEQKAKDLEEKKAAKAPDKNKLAIVVMQLQELKAMFPDMKSDEAKKVAENTKGLIDKVITYVNEQKEKL